MVEVLIEGRRLDVFEGFDFSFNYGIADIRDPNKRSTEYTKTIRCPSTPNNDLLFGHVYDVNISNPFNSGSTNIEVNFNPNKKAECRVIADGIEVMGGVVQLRQVTIDLSRYTYEVIFIGKLKNIFSVLGDDQLNGFDDNGLPLIDFSDLDHILSHTDVESSWYNTTGYTYPLIDYGLSWEFDGDNRRIYDVEDFRPAVFLKTIVDRLFAYANYTYTSAFLSSPLFEKFIIPWYSETFTLTEDQINERQMIAESDVDQEVLAGLTPIMIQNTQYGFKRLEFEDYVDTNGQWNPTNDTFSPAFIGYNEFNVNLNFTVTRIQPNVVGDVLPALLQVYRLSGGNTTIVDAVVFDIDIPENTGGTGQTATTNFQWSSMQSLGFIGDEFWVEIWFEQLAITFMLGDFTVEMNEGSRFFNVVSEQQIFEEADVYMNNFIPNVKMADLLLSVFKMFNLYVEVDPLDETNLIIETRFTYYAGGSNVDWTHKLARDKTITIQPLGLLTAKEYTYTYEEDEDYYNQRYQDSKGYTYGRRKRSIDNDFVTSKNVQSIVFSPTPLVNDGNSSRIIPKIYDADIEEGRKPTSINIRVLYYAGVLPSAPTWKYRYNAGTTIQQKSVYPYAGHLDNPITPTFDLNFGIPSELYYTANGFTGTLQYTNANLFNLYHKGYLDEVSDKDSKVMTGMFQLSALDIFNLNFRNQIIIDNCYWRLNKIMNYNPFSDGLTKVELIKVRDVIPFVATTFTNGTGGTVGSGLNWEDRPVTNRTSKTSSNELPEFQGTVNGRFNRVSSAAFGYGITGNYNYIGDGSYNVTIIGNRNAVVNGAYNVTIINTEGVTVGQSNVTVLDGEFTYPISVIDGGFDIALDPNDQSLIRVVDGGFNIVQAINTTTLTNLING